MTSSSPEVGTVEPTVPALAFAHRELRSGQWTRFGGDAVLGDLATEHTLGALAADAQAAARAQGYATGWAQGRRAAEDQAHAEAQRVADERRAAESRREAEHEAAVQALLRAAAALQQATEDTCTQVQTHAVRLAVQLTEELVGHELAVAKAPGLGAVRRALALLPGETVVRVRVAPDQASHPELAALAGTAVIVPDPTLGRGDALVETDLAVVDARVSSALQRVQKVLA